MNKEIADRWIAALKSGKYQQARQALRNSESSMCCLGVLCDLYDPTKWVKPNIDLSQINFGYPTGSGLEEGILTVEVMQWAGMKTLGAELFINDQQEQLSAMNDAGKSFTEIADLISEHWEIL